MEHYKNFSLENIVEEIDGIVCTEEWGDIKGYKGYKGAYQISTFGRLKSLYRIVGKMPNGGNNVRYCSILKQRPDKYGYLTVGLRDTEGILKSRKTHRLVALTFIENPKNKIQINHLFGVKKDNRVWKLEWATQREDLEHAKRLGLKKKIGEKHPDAKLTNKQVLEIFKSELSYKELAKLYNIITGKVSLIKTGKIWTSVTGKQYISTKGIDKHIVKSIFNSVLIPKDISIIYGVSISMISRIKHRVRYQSITSQLKTA